MKAASAIVVLLALSGCTAPRRISALALLGEPVTLVAAPRDLDVQTVTLLLDLPHPRNLSREVFEAFSQAVRAQVQRHWTIRDTIGVRKGRKLRIEPGVAGTVEQLGLPAPGGWVVLVQLDAHGVVAFAPKADFRETGGIVLRNGTHRPNPSHCLVVVVRCVLLDAEQDEVVWVTETKVGPLIDGFPMGYKHMTPELVARMTELTFGSLAER